MNDKDVEDIIMRGELTSKLDQITNELSSINSYLSDRGIYFGYNNSLNDSLSALKSGRVNKGFHQDYMCVEEIRDYLTNKDQFKSDKYGMSLENYQLYKEFKEKTFKCDAVTKTGKPCQGGMFKQDQFPKSPEDFDPNKKYYCSKHDQVGEYK